ncbi:MAG: efflux RND transporter periplasmic adaptor subunit [Desulfoprunum sp.]|nr:efflux RND transporter periplasmic adaptor subunit [Desulfoprunum sp.]
MKNLNRNKLMSIAAVLLFISGAIWWRVSLSRAEDSATAKPPETSAAKPALTVTAVTPMRADWPIQLSATGDIAAWQEALVGSEADGLRLTEVKVNVGDTVRRGQILAVFSDVTIKANVAQARAAVTEAEATMAEARANADRTRKSQAPGVMSAQQVSAYLTAEQTAAARLESAHAQLLSQQVRLDQTQLVAPDDGLISSRTATVGAVVSAGQELFRLIRANRLEWRAEVTAAELPKVRTGQAVTLSAPGGLQAKGSVRMVAPTVDRQTRTALIYVDIPSDTGLKAGMFARGDFELGRSTVLALPQSAIVQREGFNYAYSIGKDNKVLQLKVDIGRRLEDQVEITHGLEPQAKLAASGTSFLADGDTVRVVDASVNQTESKQ